MRRVVIFLMLTVTVGVYSQCAGPEGHDDQSKQPPPRHTNVVLIGATGDLATRYLWTAMFNMFRKHYVKGKSHFSFYGAARADPDTGRKTMSNTLLFTIKCEDQPCKDIKTQFVQATQYHQLKNETHYEKLAEKINENTQTLYGLQDTEFSTEEGRLVYFSIPPSQYTKTAGLVNKYLRPKLGRAWMRIVLEKPFGHDSDSARQLGINIGGMFKEEEIYRIDHYLGKTVVRNILPFRSLNKDIYENMWNGQHIDRVEIVLKEFLDVQGRTSFYEDVGVIRDMLQNHGTELLSLISMDLPEDSGRISDILNNKLHVLKNLRTPTKENAVIGQYSTYHKEVRGDLDDVTHRTNVPTFAAVALNIENTRWRDVPFLVLSGKKLDAKESYLRVVFKNNKYCVHKNSSCDGRGQIVFNIGSNDVKYSPMIALSKNLPQPKENMGWKFVDIQSDLTINGESVKDMHILIPDSQSDPYSVLVEAVFEGQRHLFVDTKSLLQSWDTWTPLLQDLKSIKPRLYLGHDHDPETLNFNIHNNRVSFDTQTDDDYQEIRMDEPTSFGQIPGTFRDRKLLTKARDDLITTLADDIYSHAKRAIRDRGIFHLTLSGGNSPILLLKHITTNFLTFPWQQTHIWQVDERCVHQDEPESNFKNLYENLLKYISIPYINIHPMPVVLSEDNPCSTDDNADIIYENAIKRLVTNQSFDFTLLGVGQDGHTASLFPNQSSLSETDKFVLYTKGAVKGGTDKRMSLSFTSINKSRYIAVLVMGDKKHVLLEELAEGTSDVESMPITGVNPEVGELAWYIDYDAYFGTFL